MSGVKCSGTEMSLAHCRHDGAQVVCPRGGGRFAAGVSCSESELLGFSSFNRQEAQKSDTDDGDFSSDGSLLGCTGGNREAHAIIRPSFYFNTLANFRVN